MSLKRNLIAAAVTAAMGLSGSAFAGYAGPMPAPADHWYLGAMGAVAFTPDTDRAGTDYVPSLGAVNVKTDYKTGWGANAEIGYKSGPLRYELEGMYMRSKVKNRSVAAAPQGGDVKVWSAMANVLYDFADGESINPYLGLGLGYANIKQTGANFGSDNEFAYQGMLGATFNVADNTDLDLGYRYFRTGKADKALGDNYQNHLVSLGIIYHMV